MNSIGAPELMTAWTDTDCDPAESAFYYVLVLEIPTPRWTAYDSYDLSVALAKRGSGIHEERAYTSPILYTSRMRGDQGRNRTTDTRIFSPKLKSASSTASTG